MLRSAPNPNPCTPSGPKGWSSCAYACLFGMSPSRSEFGPGTNTIVFKRNHSYLMLGGARGRMSWCLWHRLERRLYLDVDDVRFSKSDELAIAHRYWDDYVAETVTFGELYQSRITSTLTACMEHVFPQWYDGRIIIIGDAAHKLDPTSGQGANAALETAAALADGLRQGKFASGPNLSHDLASIFADVQAKRMGKVKWLLEDSTRQQQLKSMVTRPLEEVALRKIPKLPIERAFEGYINALDPDVTHEREAGSKL
ncbi:FAD binding domain containing protein [Lasiodiplodia theobromae]|uniref:FAD-dependent monooxygenase paxM n=1 Tax=Lasiodiplodia theobromae TaxID=45133 RepID=A0A5N5D184_9PEZI|nr:FAD binding domain containing protein [Lasiodiplodia theobromae]KAB2571182.1 FAD-dependent monooxygenase paxM [Lasiodiplodia theobromae]KAF4544383.1 FAD binding domain containing protein [Lasiodiplodia theobromae]